MDPANLAASGAPDSFEQLQRDLATLITMLESEFSALQSSQIDEFEQLQNGKEALIARIASIDLAQCTSLLEQSDAPPQALLLWEQIEANTAMCQQLQKRNELLVNKKLIVVRDTIRTLQYPGKAADQAFYNPRGKLTE